jgi:hypothetical protein
MVKGQKYTIDAGTKMVVDGFATKRDAPTTVTVARVETTRGGNLKLYWRAHRGVGSVIVRA